jgi:hypothetical protein
MRIVTIGNPGRFYQQFQHIADVARTSGRLPKNLRTLDVACDVPIASASDEQLHNLKDLVPANEGVLIPPQIWQAVLRTGKVCKMSRSVILENRVKNNRNYDEESMGHANFHTFHIKKFAPTGGPSRKHEP